MSTPTSTSAAGAGQPPDRDHEGARNVPDLSTEPARTPDAGEWFSPANGGTKRRSVLIVLLLVAGLLAGAAMSLLVVGGRAGDRRAVKVDAPSSEGSVDGPNRDEPSSGNPPQRSRMPAVVPPTPKWRPGADEVYPNAKRLASRVVERLTDFDAGSDAGAVAAATSRRFDVAPSKLRRATQELVRPGLASSGVVVYPQLAGIRSDSAAVMVVVDQTLDDGTKTWVERRIVDVRLVLREQEWALQRVRSAGGVALDRPAQLSEAALDVLEHPSIRLSDSARWDIYGGVVDDRLLAMMARAADRHEIAIVTVATGHPKNVFGTDTTSNHTLGRAVDIFSVDGEPVIDSRQKGSPAFRLARWLYNRGVPELGSPWDYDGSGGRSFTDVVHEDHIHFAM